MKHVWVGIGAAGVALAIIVIVAVLSTALQRSPEAAGLVLVVLFVGVGAAAVDWATEPDKEVPDGPDEEPPV